MNRQGLACQVVHDAPGPDYDELPMSKRTIFDELARSVPVIHDALAMDSYRSLIPASYRADAEVRSQRATVDKRRGRHRTLPIHRATLSGDGQQERTLSVEDLANSSQASQATEKARSIRP